MEVLVVYSKIGQYFSSLDAINISLATQLRQRICTAITLAQKSYARCNKKNSLRTHLYLVDTFFDVMASYVENKHVCITNLFERLMFSMLSYCFSLTLQIIGCYINKFAEPLIYCM